MKNIGIVGLGYVGLTLGIVAAMKKYNIYGVEIQKDIIDSISNDKAHFYEPSLDNLIKIHNNKNFFLVDELKKENKIEVIIITVGTPLNKNDLTPNFEYIISALKSIKKIYDGSQLIVLRSTVSVGTTRKIVLPYLSRVSGKSIDELLVAFCPERTIEGKAIHELQSLPQIIGGNNDRAIEMAEELFRKITPFIIRVESLEAAELIKLFNNTYRDIHFSIGNAFNEISQKFNIDGIQLIKDANLGYDRSNIPMPGFVSGPCLSKDAYLLTYNLINFKCKEFVINSRKYNESLEDTVINWIVKKCKKNNLSKIGISGLTFKGIPDTSDLRESSSVNIAYNLKKLGYELYLHDFVANTKELEMLNIGTVFEDIYKLTLNVKMLAIMNNNKSYKNINIFQLFNNLSEPKIILDIWNVMEIYNEINNIKIYNLGNMLIEDNYEI